MTTTQVRETHRIDELYEAWAKQGIRFVVFEFADMHGMPRSKIIPLSKFKHYAQHGLRMIGVMITVDTATNIVPETYHSEERNYGDAILRADISTAMVVPWMENTALVICDLYWPDGTPLQSAPRNVLRGVLKQLMELGYSALVALEYEFYLLRDVTTLEPVFERLHIFDTARNVAVPVMAHIMDLLPQMGIEVLTCNSEYGPGQYEITYQAQQGIVGGDQGFTFKQAVRDIAHQMNYHASFMTKPFPEQSASGSHVHISLVKKDGENAFLDSSDPLGLSKDAYHFIGGILKHAPAALALMAPTPNCYRRFVPHSFAPVNLSWGLDDRTALVRAKNTGDEETHLENRLPSALSNPYLAIATTIAAGLLGLKETLRPPELAHEPAGEISTFAPLPTSLDEALVALEGDGALRAVLGEEFTEIFIKTKRQELARQAEHVQLQVKAAELEWQRQEYLLDY